ncbi:MAG: cytidine deaminase [Owenweeksia sp.]
MKKIRKTIELWEISEEELSPKQTQILQKAEEALSGSYSPYSKFPVGAALLLEDGSVIKGANQENAAYPSGLCAERVALFHYGSNNYASSIDTIAISIARETDEFPFPCGSCLQVMSEYAQLQTSAYDILLYHRKSGKVLISKGVGNLLPFAFKKEHLPG